MIETKITIINKLGLHARAASKFVSTASAFGCEIKVGKEGAAGQLVDGKSIMSVMMLAASKGTELTLSFDGHDQQAALQAITGLINNYFEEGE
ncbi:MAG: phosphocarrier protein HPr [Paraglaciecola psychrophila]|jgi:phosphocarrier protein HPr